MPTDPQALVALKQALEQGAWRQVIAALRRVRTDEEIQAELCAGDKTFQRWVNKEKSPLRPHTERILRQAVAEWIGIQAEAPPTPSGDAEALARRLEDGAKTVRDATYSSVLVSECMAEAAAHIRASDAREAALRGENRALRARDIGWSMDRDEAEAAAHARAADEALALANRVAARLLVEHERWTFGVLPNKGPMIDQAAGAVQVVEALSALRKPDATDGEEK